MYLVIRQGVRVNIKLVLTFLFATTVIGRGQYVWMATAVLSIALVFRRRNAQQYVGSCPFGRPYSFRRCIYEIL
jgi:hypothetical protein